MTIFVKEVHNKPQPSLSPSLFFSFFLLSSDFFFFFFLHFKICKPNPRWYCWRFDSYPIEDNWSNWGYFQTAQGHLSKAVQNQCKKNYLGRNQVPTWYLYFWTFPSSTISWLFHYCHVLLTEAVRFSDVNSHISWFSWTSTSLILIKAAEGQLSWTSCV